MKFFILDERHVWHRAALEAAARFGYEGKRIFTGGEAYGERGVGFIRPHADPVALARNQVDFNAMSESLLMVQDRAQMEVYESKSEQFRRWGTWMPDTWRFTSLDEAQIFLNKARYPLVSKADVGASSINVRILRNFPEALAHAQHAFGDGIPVNHCADGPGTGTVRSLQRGYLLLQRFLPGNAFTWRVNIIGSVNAVFKRHNYPDRPVAQTGNTDPVKELTSEIEELLVFSNRFFREAETRWCAIDVLKDEFGRFRLLEASLAWPWPSPGDCDDAVFFGTRYRWRDMWTLLFEELAAGVWQSVNPGATRPVDGGWVGTRVAT